MRTPLFQDFQFLAALKLVKNMCRVVFYQIYKE